MTNMRNRCRLPATTWKIHWAILFCGGSALARGLAPKLPQCGAQGTEIVSCCAVALLLVASRGQAPTLFRDAF